MLWQLSALEAAGKIRDGQITSVELVEACLKRIGETDADIGAWAFLAADLALAQAAEMDALRRNGRPIGPLHGVPLAIKDIFDTADMPTAWGSEVHADRQPGSNAAVTDKVREAGAVILGKTVMPELTLASSVRTRNPHNADHTAGASSSGSAAGVAAGHVPVAIGSQTNGSLIRPASYCGVFGFKPTRGIISRRGCLQTSQTLDQVGVYGRTLEDVAVLADVLAGYDPADTTTYTRPKPQMLLGARAEPPVEPCLVWLDLPYHERLSAATRQGMDELLDTLGDHVERQPAPQSFDDVANHHKIIHAYEFCKNLKDDPAAQPDQIHASLQAVLERGASISKDDYEQSLTMVAGAERYFAAFFADYDAIISPAALGEAPTFGNGTGDPICSTIWTFAGLPCLSLPWLNGNTGLPVGVQLIGSAEEDDRLLRTAAWLERHLSEPEALQSITDGQDV